MEKSNKKPSESKLPPMKKLELPEDFVPPETFQTDRVLMRRLTVDDVDKDFEAVFSSIEHLQKTVPLNPEYGWPPDELTWEQDLRDLKWHQKELENRSSFAYTVMSLDEEKCLGCVYIYPSEKGGFDAKVMMWVRQSEVASGLDEHLFAAVQLWIRDEWPFQNPAYPGRVMSWEEWASLK